MSNQQETALLELLGEEGYFSLVEHFGGLVTYIPKRTDLTVMSKRIGERLATLLADNYGGEHLDIPLSRPFRAKVLYARGKTIKDIALHLTMTERHVYKVLETLTPLEREYRQRDLFENSA